MTLDDAIAHAREIAAGCGECAEEHAQLADWLDELRTLKALKEDGEAMNMLGERIKELREAARRFEGYQNGKISRELREAADTIENLRDRLQELQGAGGGECEMKPIPFMGWKCSKCGKVSMVYGDVGKGREMPRFCPNCRKAVKR